MDFIPARILLTRRMTLPSHQQRKFILAIPVSCLIASLAAFGWLQLNITIAENWVQHTQQVRLKTKRLLTALLEAETEVRGYELTRRQEFLTSYESAIASIPISMAELEQLVTDNPSQTRQLQQIRALATTRVSLLQRNLQRVTSLPDNTTLPPELASLVVEGKQIMDRARAEITQFLAEEERIQVVRDEHLRQQRQLTGIVLSLSAVMGIGGSLLAAYLLNRLEQRLIERDRNLRENEARYRLVIENFPNGVVILFDSDLRYIMADGKGLAAVGLSKAQLEGKTIWESLPPETCAVLEPIYRNAIAGTATTLEIPYADRIYLMYTLPVRNERGEVFAGMAMSQDITERKQAEEQLSASEARYRQLVELCPDGIFINRQGKFVLVNRAAVELFGATNSEQLLGKPILDFVHPDDQEIVKERIRQLAENPNPVPLIEEKWFRLDGTIFYAEVVAIPLTYQGEPAAQVVIRDISQRKQAEKQLHQLNRSLKTISECNQALVRATDEAALLQDICRIIVDFGGYCSAWIAFAESDEAKSVRPVAQVGFEPGFLESLQLTWSDSERGHGPTGTAIRTGNVSIVQNILTDPKYMPWREAAIKQGYAASIALPLIVDGQLLGALDIYAREPHAFNEAEVQLLTELANDLAYGITVLRTQTEHHQAEAALRESKQRLDSILNSIEDVVWSVSAINHELLYMSPAVQNIYGRPVQEFVNNPHLWLDVVHPEDYEQVANLHQSLLERGSVDQEYRILRPDGEVRWIYDRSRVTYSSANEADGLAQRADSAQQQRTEPHVTGRTLPVRNGSATEEMPSDHCLLEHRTPIRLDGIVTDITARKQSEMLVRDSEAKFRAFLEAASEAVIVTNARGEILVFNAKAEELFGYQSSEVLGHTVEFLMPERFHQRHVTHRAGYREQPTKRSMSNTRNLLARRKDGTEFPIEAGLSPVQTKDGTFVMTFLTDITERKQAEEEIRRLNESLERRVVEVETRYEQIVELAEEGIWVVDKEAKTTYVNHAMARMLGYTEAEILGRPIFDFINEADHQTAHTNADHRQQGIAAKHEFKLKTRDGKTLWTYMSTSPVLDENGNLLWSCALVYDITERKKADEQLRESTERISLANAELARATRLKDEFLASMSHELRTPLNAILGLSEALQEEVYGPLTQRQHRSLSTIEQSGRHLLELITDILDLSKIESGKMELQLTWASPRSLCESSLTFVRQQAHHKSIKISSKIPEGLGDIEVDERRMRQVLVNLLSNAVKFTPEGGEVRVEVAADPDAEILELSVIDTGIGIAQENLNKLFKPFVQLDSSLSRRYAGTGLGLALVRRIVELHGGSVSLESEVGQGSRFTLTLPWKELDQIQPSVRYTEQTLVELPSIHQALIVEDSETAAKQVARYLAELGSAAFIHPHGEGAVEAVLRFDPEVVILDLLLPHLSGWEVLTQLKANPATQHIPVLIISVVDERSRALELGASEYLVKPISRTQLQLALSKIFATDSQRLSHAALVVMPEEERQLPSILLVEDNEANISTVMDYLQIHGFRVILARNGIEAVEMARQQKPELILMDIQMPEMDGLEATRRIHSDADLVHIPIIALTSLAMPGDRERCLAVGAREYLTKPVSLKKLVSLIAQYISRSDL